jgi:hypothetical protein
MLKYVEEMSAGAGLMKGGKRFEGACIGYPQSVAYGVH